MKRIFIFTTLVLAMMTSAVFAVDRPMPRDEEDRIWGYDYNEGTQYAEYFEPQYYFTQRWWDNVDRVSRDTSIRSSGNRAVDSWNRGRD